jgi:hypothetical protein
MRRQESLESTEGLCACGSEAERDFTESVLSNSFSRCFLSFTESCGAFFWPDIGFVSELMRFEERELGRSFSSSSPINPPISSTTRFRESLPSVLPSAMSERTELGGLGSHSAAAAAGVGMSEGRKEGKGVWTFMRRGEMDMARRASKAGLESGAV